MSTATPYRSSFRAGFTLLEIMVVVGIMGMIMAAGAPTLYRMFHKEGFRKTVNDLMDVCSTARAQAIMRDKTMEVVFHPREGRCEVEGAAADAGGWGGRAHSAKIAGGVIQMLDINMREYKDADAARVRFFPNGTSDEMTLILRSDKGEQCGISLEITTGLASFMNESDLQKLRRGLQ